MKKLSVVNKLLLSSALTLGTLMAPLHASQFNTEEGKSPSQGVVNALGASTSSNIGGKRSFEASAGEEEPRRKRPSKEVVNATSASSSSNTSNIGEKRILEESAGKEARDIREGLYIEDPDQRGAEDQKILKKANTEYVRVTSQKIDKDWDESTRKAKEKEIAEARINLGMYIYELNKAAREGNTEAQKTLAFWHQRGLMEESFEKSSSCYISDEVLERVDDKRRKSGLRGAFMRRNLEVAAFWWEKVANKGDAIAQNNLGFFCQYYSHKWKLQEKFDYKNAESWYTKAANQGDAKAQNNLGYCYQWGLGGAKKDLERAALWYTKAANQGNTEAQKNLEYFREWGLGVGEDVSK